jgi:hypothetical protein
MLQSGSNRNKPTKQPTNNLELSLSAQGVANNYPALALRPSVMCCALKLRFLCCLARITAATSTATDRE